VVVDNASKDDTAAMLHDRPNVAFLRNARNEGFGRACNRGAALAQTEFLLFLNPDARLKPGALPALEREADAREELGAANPLITDHAGRARLKMSSVLPVPKLPRPEPQSPGRMPVLSGAALFVRRALFEEVGGFDPAIFLYHEDHELCSRILAAGYELWHLPSAHVVHVQGTGAPREAGTAYLKGYQMARSRAYVIEKTCPGAGFRRTFWPALLGYISPAGLVSRRRRAKYRGQLAGALSARNDGGRFDG
jgi:N-acetylglucosaminyl-diphospho-decaprenol L-rhamnosyltransferase